MIVEIVNVRLIDFIIFIYLVFIYIIQMISYLGCKNEGIEGSSRGKGRKVGMRRGKRREYGRKNPRKRGPRFFKVDFDREKRRRGEGATQYLYIHDYFQFSVSPIYENIFYIFLPPILYPI